MKKTILGLLVVSFVAGVIIKFSFAQQKEVSTPLIEILEFREVDIKDILRQLAKQYNLNIVFSENVRGLVTVQLSNVTIDQALDSIITVNGFAYTKKDNVYKVTTIEEAEREGKQTKLFKLNYASAMQLKDTLSKVLSPSGSIEADSRSNSLVVTDTVSVLNKIEAMLPALDETNRQVLIEARLIETSLLTSENLGINWSTTVSLQGAIRKTTFPFDPKGKGELSKNLFPVSSGSSFPADSPYSFPYATTSDFVLGTLDFSSFTAILNFLKNRTDSKLIAAPRVIAVNNQKAKINVGKVVPIATYTLNETTGAWEITGWEEQNIGINLEVTPQISPDGYIKIKLKPEVSNIFDYIGEGVNQRPIIQTRTAETEVQIKDGQTIVLGGLVKTKEYASQTRIPGLSSLPLVGKIFTYKQKGSKEEPEEQTDLLIFVTARILKDGDKSVIDKENNFLVQQRPFKLEKRKIIDVR
ncbi:MAG: secretin and TonB N-terminal domain-containing protein [Candidatus Omnitrophica bacterium]|nr:secretin and TonB N-terminal domain-containing protein [Candidatus Omnitrophota bacterium]